MKVAIEDFKTMCNCVSGYDMYPQYIDSYKQQVEAEERNKEYDAKFAELIKKYNPNFSGRIRDIREEMADQWDAISEKTGKQYTNEDWLNLRNEAIKRALVPVKTSAKKVWTEEEIKNCIQTNDKALYGALRKLYGEQTADEQDAGETKHHNGVGFNGADSKIMSSFAEFLNRTGFLTTKQKAIARKKMVKYTKQLTKLANA